jgi:hypothetical protein
MPTDLQSSPAQAKFLRTLSASMHQMAQPLSTIQLTLELALLSPTTIEQYKEVAESLLQQLRRAVESMQFAAWLARFQQPAADVQDVPLDATLENVISDLQRTLEAAQLQLLFLRSERKQLIRISPTRLRQMLFYVLQAVQGCSQPGDLVQIEIQETAGRLALRIHHAQRETSRPDSATSSRDDLVDRALALAEAIVSSAGGEFSVTTDPLMIVADFPVHAADSTGKSHLSDVANLQLAASSH